MKNFLILIFFLFSSNVLFATNVSGGVYSNTTWDTAGSPYVVTGNLVVFDGVTLTIDPGVTVLIDAGTGIEIRGKLVAIGTASENIVIKGNTSANELSFWPGIVFTGTTKPAGSDHQAILKYCTVSNAAHCFDLDFAYRGPYTFRNCTFSYNNAINNDGGEGGMLFDSCNINHNNNGFSYFQFGGTISNCIFDSNNYGVNGSDRLINCKFTHHTQIAVQPYGYTDNCEITDNNIGVQCLFNSTNNTFTNNKVKNNNVGVNIQSYFNGYINFTNNEICNNTTNNIVLGTSNNADLSHNCWCTTDSGNIRSKISDGYVDVSKGLVNFMPYKTTCTLGTPVITHEAPEINIFPLPARLNDIIYVRSNILESGAEIRLINMLGNNVHATMSDIKDNILSVNLNGIQAGIYIVIITNAKGEHISKKVLIE